MKPKKIANIIFVTLNFLLLLFLVEKVQNPKIIYENLPVFKRDTTSVLPARDVKEDGAVVVARVLDGDTIELSDGRKVRYIGIDTPEIGSENECFSEEAKKRNEDFVLGKNVILEKDISETDRYGRLLRYVYVTQGEAKIMVNETLVEEGYATVATFPPDVKNKDKFLELQNSARLTQSGLWAKCN